MVTSWGTGRKDWSKNIELSVVPITRSHQYRSFAGQSAVDATAYDFATIDEEGTYGTIGVNVDMSTYIGWRTNFYLYSFRVDYDANVMIKAYCGWYNTVTGEFVRRQVKYGFGSVEFVFPKGFMLSLDDMDDGWTPVIEFLPGGYTLSFATHGMVDKMVSA